VDEPPPLRDPTIARWHYAITIALCQRRHGLGVGLGHYCLGFNARSREHG
jgi:hypothetical protein